MNSTVDFQAFLTEELKADFTKSSVINDGRMHRFALEGDRDSQKSGWYHIHDNGDFVVAVYGNWRSGIVDKWVSVEQKNLTEAQKQRVTKFVSDNKQKHEAERTQKAEEAKKWAKRILPISKPASPSNAYLVRKKIQPHSGVKEYNGVLQIPVLKKNDIVGVQFINPDGSKYFKAGTDVKDGAYFQFGKAQDNATIIIAEGYATGASIYENTDVPVRLAFQAGNLLGLAKATREEFPNARIIMAADNDIYASNGKNRGVDDSTTAAKAINGEVIIPKFDGLNADFMKANKIKDFNDVHVHLGADSLRQQFSEALSLNIEHTEKKTLSSVEAKSSEPLTKKRDHRQEVTDTIISLLEQGVAPWQKKFVARPPEGINGNVYRGGNALYLTAISTKKGFDDNRWMTYKQATERGWQVRKGEKASVVEFWQFTRKEKQPDGTEKEVPLDRPFAKYYNVFNASQIDGVPPLPKRDLSEFEALSNAEKLLADSGAVIKHSLEDRAFYRPSTDEIQLPNKVQFETPIDYYATATHELAHWTGHESRLNRDLTGGFGSENYAKEELRAEIASMFIQGELGIPHNTENHASYVGSWIKALKEDKNEIFKASKDASVIADYVKGLSLTKEKTNVADVAQSLDVSTNAHGLPMAQYTPKSNKLSLR